MAVHCNLVKLLRKKINLELFETFILNFLYIHCKLSKKKMSSLYRKRQFIYLNKVNSPPTSSAFHKLLEISQNELPVIS